MISRNTVPLFPLGRVVSTHGALDLGIEFGPYLSRHERGEWGPLLTKGDIVANDHALAVGERILSYFEAPSGDRFYVITEGDRSYTTILLPDEY